ncbi:hypothetical protein [Streptomyces sp. H39-S7]|uniref:hypothetical protein n=1 Tax=Streptomyces sp. H39-S7 TaxID=3004357 RepID=UPI0022AEB652|nr:hypothetical protein [Streptomyces sp. H39-S7]MCZ4125690.1 hypothetical protein [Streptomyces sp. H39-S7]
MTYDTGSGKRHAASLALSEEAVAAARLIGPLDPARAEILYGALDTCQRELYTLGRRAAGLAMRAEMLAIGRAHAELFAGPVVKGLNTWARGLSEAGRYTEAADAMTELIEASLSEGPVSGDLTWSLLEWIAALHSDGRSGQALTAFETLVSMEAAEAANDRGPMACHLYSLIGYATMLDTYGRVEQAALTRQEALALLTELADTGERKSWSSYQTTFWAVLLSFSGADSEHPASDGPRPPSGAALMQWSPGAKQWYFDSRPALREQIDAVTAQATEDPDQHLAELVRLHRTLTARSAVYWEDRTHLFAERVRSLYDDGVDLGRRLSQHDPVDGTRTLAGVLIDRSNFHTAAREFKPALDDFREALDCLGEAAGGW